MRCFDATSQFYTSSTFDAAYFLDSVCFAIADRTLANLTCSRMLRAFPYEQKCWRRHGHNLLSVAMRRAVGRGAGAQDEIDSPAPIPASNLTCYWASDGKQEDLGRSQRFVLSNQHPSE